MHICSFSAKTSLTPQALWQLWTNPRHWPRWDSNVQTAELSGPFKQGIRGSITQADGSTLAFSILSCDMVQSFVLSFPLTMGVEMLVKREWKQEGDQMLFRHEVSLMGPALGKMMHASRKEALKKSTLATMEKLLGVLEQETSPQEHPSGAQKPAL